jgi:hypothetical protein
VTIQIAGDNRVCYRARDEFRRFNQLVGYFYPSKKQRTTVKEAVIVQEEVTKLSSHLHSIPD